MDAENKKQDAGEIPNVEREGWNVEELIEQGAHENPDEVLRKVLRGDEKKQDGDERDIAGSPQNFDTPQQREESKP